MPCPVCGYRYDDPNKNETCDDCWATKLVRKMKAAELVEIQSETYCKGYRNLATRLRMKEFFGG